MTVSSRQTAKRSLLAPIVLATLRSGSATPTGQTLSSSPHSVDRIAQVPAGLLTAEIAFSLTQAGQREIYVIDLAKGKTRRLTINPADDNAPSWSQDGRWSISIRTATGKAGFGKCPPQAVKQSK